MPLCGSQRLTQSHRARRILGLIGTLAGAAGSGLRVLRGAEFGGALGATAGPPGMALGAVAGAVLAALTGGSTGCAIGVSLGDAIDGRLLNGLHCQDCRGGSSSPAHSGGKGSNAGGGSQGTRTSGSAGGTPFISYVGSAKVRVHASEAPGQDACRAVRARVGCKARRQQTSPPHCRAAVPTVCLCGR